MELRGSFACRAQPGCLSQDKVWHCPAALSACGLGLLPLLLSRDVQRVHDEPHGLRDLLGPDCVLFKFGLHCRLRDALLEQAETLREVGAARASSQGPGLGGTRSPDTRIKGLTSNLLSKF